MLTQKLFTLGIILILIGFASLIASIILAIKENKIKSEGGFAIFIGPIPIINATSKAMFYAMVIISIVLLAIFLIISKIII